MRHGGRRGTFGAGGAGSSGTAEELPVSRGHDTGDKGIGIAGVEWGREVGKDDRRADGSGGQERAVAGAGRGQAVRDADRGYFFDFRTGDVGTVTICAVKGKGRGRLRNRG